MLILRIVFLKLTLRNISRVDFLNIMMQQPAQCREECSSLNKIEQSIDIEKKKKLVENDELFFDKTFKTLCIDLTADNFFPNQLTDASKWFKRVLEYNIPHGKRNRGLAVLSTFRHLNNGQVADEELFIASVLGWCIELLQAFFLISDDIMDNSITRRGQPCWYKLEDVGLIAVNDALYIESTIYQALKKYVSTKPYYLLLIELFHETTSQTISGQALDLLTAPVGKSNFKDFNIERYQAIVKYKTAFYSFYLPVACALYMTNINDMILFNEAKDILLDIGEYFQIQDDYLDCYGDVSVTGKIGTDIEDNKCSWLVVQALQLANPQQKIILQENYAHHDAHKVAKVKQLYNELNIVDLFKKYEDESFQNLICSINKLKNVPLQKALTDILNRIYKRQK